MIAVSARPPVSLLLLSSSRLADMRDRAEEEAGACEGRGDREGARVWRLRAFDLELELDKRRE